MIPISRRDKRPSACPAPNCRAVNPLQQEAAQQLIASGIEGDWLRNGRRCSECGCVYILNGVTKVIKGHLNSDPIFQTYQAYLLLKNAGFVDAFRTARPTDPGFTFGQAEDLLNVISSMSHRIDLVQFRGPFTVEDVQVVGASPADRTRLGLWPSDHAGVVATLTLSNGD